MNGETRFYFLAEAGGWNCQKHAYDYQSMLFSSDAYQILSYNVIYAKEHLGRNAQEVVDAYNNLEKDPKSLMDVFIIENTIDYLALHSFPEYYLNPLAIDPNYVGSVESIGDLILDIHGQSKSINEWIEDETMTISLKKEAIKNRIDEYRSDMESLVDGSITITKKRAFVKENRRKAIVNRISEYTMMVLFNIFLFFFFVFPNEYFITSLYVFNFSNVTSYLAYIYPMSVFLFDLSFVIYHSYRSRISEPYNYARRFLKKGDNRIFSDIERKANELYDYIASAIELRITLKNDITAFSRLSSSYVDFQKIYTVDNLEKDKNYRLLRSLRNATLALATIFFILTIIFYFMDFGLEKAI